MGEGEGEGGGERRRGAECAMDVVVVSPCVGVLVAARNGLVRNAVLNVLFRLELEGSEGASRRRWQVELIS